MNEASRLTVIYSILVHMQRKQTDLMPLFRLNVLHKKVRAEKKHECFDFCLKEASTPDVKIHQPAPQTANRAPL